MARRLIPLLLLLAAAPAAAGEAASARFAALSRGYSAAGPDLLPAFRAALLAEHPDFWEVPLAGGRLRSDLAAELGREEIVALFARASRQPELRRERWAALAVNLGSRPDLPEILLAVNALPLLVPDDIGFLTEVALDVLLDGEPAFPLALLSDPRAVESAADDLLDADHPEGLRLLADILAGRLELPPESRALLGNLEPDIGNRYLVRPLGPGRIAALARVAGEDPDPALRLLAVRLLLYSGDAGAGEATVRAYAGLADPRVAEYEWREIGEQWGALPADDDVPLVMRKAVLAGVLGDGTPEAGYDRDGAEALAAKLRRLLATTTDLRFRALVLRTLHWHDGTFVAYQDVRRPHTVPSWRGLIEDLRRGREDDPASLRRLAGRVAALLAGALSGDIAQRLKGEVEPDPSPVVARLKALLRSADPQAGLRARVADWLELDPYHLLDPDFGDALEMAPALRPLILDAYPRDAVRRLLLAPPGPHRDEDWGKYAADDLSGAVNRDLLLALLAFAPAHHAPARDPAVVGGWPARNRRSAGRALQVAGVAPEELADLLADDEFAVGYFSGALLGPGGAGFDRAARLVAGEFDRPELLDRLADWAEDELPERLSHTDDEDPWPEEPPELSPELRAELGARLREDVDPWRAWLPARVLAVSGTPPDLAVLLANGQDLDLATIRSRHPFRDLARGVESRAGLEVLLAAVADETVAPRARLAILDGLSWLDWFDRLPPDEVRAAEERMMEWIATAALRLSGAMAESVLELWHRQATQSARSDRAAATAAFLRAVNALPAEAPRIRLVRLLGD